MAIGDEVNWSINPISVGYNMGDNLTRLLRSLPANMQQTSLEAFRERRKLGMRGQYRLIVETLSNEELSDESIANRTGLQYSTVNPRRGELVKMGIVKHRGYTRNERGKTVMVWGV